VTARSVVARRRSTPNGYARLDLAGGLAAERDGQVGTRRTAARARQMPAGVWLSPTQVRLIARLSSTSAITVLRKGLVDTVTLRGVVERDERRSCASDTASSCGLIPTLLFAHLLRNA
jgi:hypothetical protein